MARPYDNYVRFLVTKGLEETEQYNEALTDLCLPKVDDAAVDKQYRLVFDMLPAPLHKQIQAKKYEGDFLKWMKVLEVEDLWLFEKQYKTKDTAHLKLLYDIHTDPRLRITIGALLLKGVKHDDVCQSINLKFAAMLKPIHIDLYEKYFWNVRRMTRKDWKAYLGTVDNHEKSILFLCLSEDIEAVKVALDMPAKTSVSDMLQFLLANAYQKAKHYLRVTSVDTNAEARKWIDETLKLCDKYEKHRTGNLEDFSKSLQMEFDYVESDFMTPDDQMRDEMRRAKTEIEAAADSQAAKDVENG